MLVEIEKYIGVLCKLKITPNQFLFCWLTHQHMYAESLRYVTEGNGFSREEIYDLVSRGLAMDFNKNDRFFFDDFVISDEFVNLVFADDKTQTGMEFWNGYPAQIFIDGKPFPGRNANQDDFLRDYYLLIGHSPAKHKRVMEALEYAKSHSMITQGLKNWFASRQWETIQQLMVTHATTNRVLPGEQLF